MKGDPSMAASKEAIRAAPTKELGAPGMVMSGMGIFGGGTGATPDWGYFVDDREFAEELAWPRGVEKYERMETSDAQVKGLMLATTMPPRRFHWEFDPNEARPEAVDLIAEDFNLPVRGEDERRKTRRGFNHDRHMGHALRALGQGHYHFEEQVEYHDPDEGGDGLLHLVKLGTRPPRSIIGIRTDDHGNLTAVEQMSGGLPSGGRILGGVAGLGVKVLEANPTGGAAGNRLLTYLWDTADDGDQCGRSILRSVYRNWLIKDALIRVDAVKHERNAMGIPWFEVDPAASKDQIESLAKRAEEIRASTVGGGAGPGKLRIAGVEGVLPDTIGSIRYHDEQMAKALMLLLYNLGGDAASGARALGDTFMDWYLYFQGALADWYAEMTQAFIDRQVERNFGPDEQSPLLTYTRIETAELAFADFALGVKEGLILPGPELSAYIEERFKVPGQTEAAEKQAASPPQAAPAAPQLPPAPEPPQTPPAASERRSQPKRSALAEKMASALAAPMTWPQLARAAGTDPKNGTARRARDLLLSEGAVLRGTDGTLQPVRALALPDRDLKRQPLAFEVAAQVNFAAMEETFMQGRETLVDAYRAAQAAQIEQLVAEVEAAEGDAAKLASLSCDPVDLDVLVTPLTKIAEEGVASARAEHEAQMGVEAKATVADKNADKNRGHNRAIALAEPEIDGDQLDKTVRERAEAASLTLAGGLATSASKKAAAVSALEPEAAATAVRDHLTSLSDAALNEQLGGATQQAYNRGRASYMRAAGPKEIVASEILDGNACANCNAVDGTEYENLAAAEVDYPLGGFVSCEAGLRCRGTLIAVY